MQTEEAKREMELERLCDAEVEKMWEKKVKQWKLEKEARRKLLQEVMEGRRQQLQDKRMLGNFFPLSFSCFFRSSTSSFYQLSFRIKTNYR